MNQSRSYYFPKYLERKEAIHRAFNEKSTKNANTLRVQIRGSQSIKNCVIRIKISYDYASHSKLLSNVGKSKQGGQSL